ncbi:hypothetical protein DV735_g3972, partial [Chaetothyriales sp. CBS 134920]
MALATLSRVATWRTLFILLCLLNIKSLPFAWHIRLFYQFCRHIRAPTPSLRRGGQLVLKPGETHPIFKSVSIHSRTPLYETDYNLHKSNSTYFIDLDESRTALIAKIYGPGLRNGGEQALEREGYPGRISVILGSVHTSFHNEIKPYELYEVRSRVLGWDKKWLVIISFFIRPAKGRRGKEVLLASALSKYVVKKKRFTVSPDRCLRESALLPPAPKDGETADKDGQKTVESNTESASTVLVGRAPTVGTEESESATPQSDNETTGRPLPGSALVAAEVLESLSNAVHSQKRQSEDDVAALVEEPKALEWNWYRIEAERVRGLEKARAWLALDTDLKDEYEAEQG